MTIKTKPTMTTKTMPHTTRTTHRTNRFANHGFTTPKERGEQEGKQNGEERRQKTESILFSQNATPFPKKQMRN